MVVVLLSICLPIANRQQLNKDCKALSKCEVTREELLSAAETPFPDSSEQVDSSTDNEGTPIKSTGAKTQTQRQTYVCCCQYAPPDNVKKTVKMTVKMMKLISAI